MRRMTVVSRATIIVSFPAAITLFPSDDCSLYGTDVDASSRPSALLFPGGRYTLWVVPERGHKDRLRYS